MEGPHAEDEEADQLRDLRHKNHDDGNHQLHREVEGGDASNVHVKHKA